MKNILKTTFFALFLIVLGSCEEDTHPVAQANGITLLSIAPSGPYVLSPLEGDNDVATFSWSATDNGVETIASTYVIEIALSGTNFANPIATNASTPLLTYTWKEGALNKILIDNGFIADVPADIDIRIKSTLGLGAHPFVQYSNIISAKVTPFAQPSFAFTKNGENPANAPKLISSGLFATDCEGYAWLEAGSYKFYTAIQNVYQTSNPFYGDNGAGGLELNGADVVVATAGFYLIKADTGLNSYSVKVSEWGLFGTATANPIDRTKMMTYNQATKNWETTISLKGGRVFQFRNQYRGTPETLILGLFDATKVGADYAGTQMSYNGLVISLPGTEPANYKVTLNLNTPRAYTYTLVQQ